MFFFLGVYECIHIMKKSLPFKEYRKKAMEFDKIAENKSIERVEDMVKIINFLLFSIFGDYFPIILLVLEEYLI